jgi:hypothetical protein
MRRALITVFFVSCLGSIAFHAMAGLQEKTTHNIPSLPNQVEIQRINVSTMGQTKEISRPTKKSNDATVDSVPSEGKGRVMMVAVLMLMGAIALRRILSAKA